MKHTKGIWIVSTNRLEILNNSKTGTFGLLAKTFDHEQIDGTGNYGFSREEAEANARLIAAAPDLLEFAKEMEGFFEVNTNGYGDLAEMCKKAIAKAEGENHES